MHLPEAIRQINERILPALKFSPAELLLGLVVNTPRTPVEGVEGPASCDDVILQGAYVQQQQLDGYSKIVEHALKRKAQFDARVKARAPGEVTFEAGQLVQVYRNDLDFTVSTARKMEPKWSAPRRVVSRDRNSYKLATLEGLTIGGMFSARRLRRFIPRSGTALAEAQAVVEAALGLGSSGGGEGGQCVEEESVGRVGNEGKDASCLDGQGEVEESALDEAPVATHATVHSDTEDSDCAAATDKEVPTTSKVKKLRRSKRLMQIFSRVLRRRRG